MTHDHLDTVLTVLLWLAVGLALIGAGAVWYAAYWSQARHGRAGVPPYRAPDSPYQPEMSRRAEALDRSALTALTEAPRKPVYPFAAEREQHLRRKREH